VAAVLGSFKWRLSSDRYHLDFAED